MVNMNMIQALNSALDNMLERDSDVIIYGEDVGYFGGVTYYPPKLPLEVLLEKLDLYLAL